VNRFKGKLASIDSYLTDDEIIRMARTISKIPLSKGPNDLLVDVGGSIFWVPLYKEILGYRKVIILCYPNGGHTTVFDREEVGIGKGFNFEVLDCDAEVNKYPLDSGQASCVVSFELIEHLAGDPMNLISESNRILKDNGYFCLTTPNVISKTNLAKLALGLHPFGWSVFTDTYADRHNREYTPFEIKKMFEDGGFEMDLLQTFTNKKNQSFTLNLLGNFLSFPGFLVGKVPLGMRENHMLILGKKNGAVRKRYPEYLYKLYGKSKVNFKLAQGIIDEKNM
jgi:SAM-dependent methyltransferase